MRTNGLFKSVKLAISTGLILSLLLFILAAMFRSIDNALCEIFERLWIPYGGIEIINQHLFDSGHNEGGILTVILVTWAMYVFPLLSTACFMLFHTIDRHNRTNGHTVVKTQNPHEIKH